MFSVFIASNYLFFYCIPEQRNSILTQIASVREVVLGAPLKVLLKHLASKTVAPNVEKLVALVHRPNESFFLAPQV
jgi:actin related protein 2/3 complex, subunit 2